MKKQLFLLCTIAILNPLFGANESDEARVLRVCAVHKNQKLKNKVISNCTVIGQQITIGPDGKPHVERNIREVNIRDMTPEEIEAQERQKKERTAEQKRLRIEREAKLQRIENEKSKDEKSSSKGVSFVAGAQHSPETARRVAAVFKGASNFEHDPQSNTISFSYDPPGAIYVAMNLRTGKSRIMDGPSDLRDGEFKNAVSIGSSREAVMREWNIDPNDQ